MPLTHSWDPPGFPAPVRPPLSGKAWQITQNEMFFHGKTINGGHPKMVGLWGKIPLKLKGDLGIALSQETSKWMNTHAKRREWGLLGWLIDVHSYRSLPRSLCLGPVRMCWEDLAYEYMLPAASVAWTAAHLPSPGARGDATRNLGRLRPSQIDPRHLRRPRLEYSVAGYSSFPTSPSWWFRIPSQIQGSQVSLWFFLRVCYGAMRNH